MFSLRGKRGTTQFEIFVVSMKIMAVFATESSFEPFAILSHFTSIAFMYSALVTSCRLSAEPHQQAFQVVAFRK